MHHFIKSGLRRATATTAFAAFVTLMERWKDRRPGVLRVLMYHRIDWETNRPHLNPALLSADPETFAQQMEHLARRYHVVSIDEVVAALADHRRLPRRAVLLTFDDAYQDFAEHAWPTLKRHGLPATLFVATGYPDRPERAFWWDRLQHALLEPAGDVVDTPCGQLALTDAPARERALRRIVQRAKELPHAEAMAMIDEVCRQLSAPASPNPVLSWDELRRLAAEGVTLGAHTCNHPLLNRLAIEEAREEMVQSQRTLEAELGTLRPIVAYPAGGISPEVIETARRAGFVLGFTTQRGLNHLRVSDPLRLRRINVGRHTPHAAWRAQLVSL